MRKVILPSGYFARRRKTVSHLPPWFNSGRHSFTSKAEWWEGEVCPEERTHNAVVVPLPWLPKCWLSHSEDLHVWGQDTMPILLPCLPLIHSWASALGRSKSSGEMAQLWFARCQLGLAPQGSQCEQLPERPVSALQRVMLILVPEENQTGNRPDILKDMA